MDVIIIGGGPAGVTAAIYAARGGLATTVINVRGGSLLRAHKIENYYGFAAAVSGDQLYDAGLAQARALGVTIIDAETTHIFFDNNLFTVTTTAGEYLAPAVVLASGAGRKTPPIKGIRDYEGKGVSYCAVCDAFFFKKKNVAVLGSGDYALEEAGTLARVAGTVTLLTNGDPSPKTEFPVVTDKVEEILGDGNKITGVRLSDGSVFRSDGLFVALGIAGSSALAAKLGAATDGDYIRVDNVGQTSIPGLYAAGDCTGGLKQVSAAIHQGAEVGLQLARTLKH